LVTEQRLFNDGSININHIVMQVFFK
jgi:hypothetical protein